MKSIIISSLAVAIMFSAGTILAADFSQHSTEELSKMRGTMQNVSSEEREAFRTEWQSRLQNMTQEERQQYAGRPENAGQGKEQMIRQRQRMNQQNATQSGSYGTGSGAAARGGKGYGAAGGRGNR